jgi:hypothetical protein
MSIDVNIDTTGDSFVISKKISIVNSAISHANNLLHYLCHTTFPIKIALENHRIKIFINGKEAFNHDHKSYGHFKESVRDAQYLEPDCEDVQSVFIAREILAKELQLLAKALIEANQTEKRSNKEWLLMLKNY